MPVLPGNYSVTMSKFVDGKITELAGPVEFETEPLDNVLLPAQDRKALVDFQKEINDILGAIQATGKTLKSMEEKINLITKTIKAAENTDPDMLIESNRIMQRLHDFDKKLNGDKSISKRAGNQSPSISYRIGYIVFTMWNTTSKPTETNRESYSIASNQLEKLLIEMRALRDDRIKKLEAELEQINAPWTPGRFPQWKAK